MLQNLVKVGFAILLVGCADTASNVGRATLAVGTLGISEYGRSQREAKEAALEEKCAPYKDKGSQYFQCIEAFKDKPAAEVNVKVVNQPAQ